MAANDKKAAAKAAAAGKPVEVTLVALEAIEPIRHDGVDIAPGDAFAVPDDVAAQLIAIGAAKAVE